MRPAACASVVALALAGCTLDRTGAPGTDASTSASGEGGLSSIGPSGSGGAGAKGSPSAVGSGAGGSESGGGSETGGGSEAVGGGPSVSSSSANTASASSTGSGGNGPACGDNAIEAPEQCDDGGQIAGDRCGPTCLDEHPDTCPGTPIALGAGVLVITDTTVGAEDNLQDTQDQGSCRDDHPGPDLIYAVTPAVSGRLNVDLDADYADHFLVLRTACPSSGSDIIDCDYDDEPEQTDHVDQDVVAGATYFVVVDSYDENAGTFSLRLELEG